MKVDLRINGANYAADIEPLCFGGHIFDGRS